MLYIYCLKVNAWEIVTTKEENGKPSHPNLILVHHTLHCRFHSQGLWRINDGRNYFEETYFYLFRFFLVRIHQFDIILDSLYNSLTLIICSIPLPLFNQNTLPLTSTNLVKLKPWRLWFFIVRTICYLQK